MNYLNSKYYSVTAQFSGSSRISCVIERPQWHASLLLIAVVVSKQWEERNLAVISEDRPIGENNTQHLENLNT